MLRRKLKPLVDDFPRKLNRFEVIKIKEMMKRNLDSVKHNIPQEKIVDVSEGSSKQIITDKNELIYRCLETWPIHVALKSLNQVSSLKDERVEEFLSRVFSKNLDRDTLIELLELMVDRFETQIASQRVNQVLYGLVHLTELDALSDAQLLVMSKAVAKFGSSDNDIIDKLVELALQRYHVASLLILNRIRVGKTGNSIFPEILIPSLSKSELIILLESVEDCEIPQVIARTVELVSDELSRLSFHRLVDDKDRVLRILFKLKLKLDSLVYVEPDNPFYTSRASVFLKRKILPSISSSFQQQVLSLPMSQVAQKMLLLNGVNSLKLDSVDIVANRIQSFGDTLLRDLDPTHFTMLLYTISNHPCIWKRKDKYRNQIGTVVARNFERKINVLNQPQLVSCIQSMMVYHNSAIRSVIALEAIPLIDPSQIKSIGEAISLCRICVKLIDVSETKVQEKMSEIILRGILESSQLITTPQTVEILEICASARLVEPAKIFANKLSARLLDVSGLISPTNIGRVLHSIASLQLRDMDSLTQSLLTSLGSPSDTHSRLLARIVSDIALISLANPTIDNLWVENALLTLSVPKNFETITDNESIAKRFANAMPLLGESGKMYTDHLAVSPGNMLDSLLSSAKLEPTRLLRKEEWDGLLPKSTSFIGDVLGALVDTEDITLKESGGFELYTSRVWRNVEKKIQVNIVRAKDCARDESRHILARAATGIARDRNQGWRVVLVPEILVEQLMAECPEDLVKKRVRRAKIIHGKNLDEYSKLVDQLREIFSS